MLVLGMLPVQKIVLTKWRIIFFSVLDNKNRPESLPSGSGYCHGRQNAFGGNKKDTKKDGLNTFFLSVQSRIPPTEIKSPEALSESVVHSQKEYQYIILGQTEFVRPLYIKILTLLLILLVSAAAAYAVFMRPLNELVISSGALVLGVWGKKKVK